jgi:hypothetical protein
MLTMRDHGVEDYEVLRDMDATDVGDLRDDDRACLDELGQYLVATDAWPRCWQASPSDCAVTTRSSVSVFG